MKDIRTYASYLVASYERVTGNAFKNEPLYLQKLLYFAQRESYVLSGKPLFDYDFEGWVNGPLIPSLWKSYKADKSVVRSDFSSLNDEERYVIDNTISQYGIYDAWYLRELSHKESSWLKSREGLGEFENGNRIIDKADIQDDALKVRQYDHIYDMYIDEFEDAD